MPLQSASIKSGATWAPTGGSDLVFAADGRAITDGVRVVVVSDSDLLLRRSLVAKSQLPGPAPKAGAPARLGRNQMTYFVPFKAADGLIYNQSIGIVMNLHAEYSLASRTALKADAAALLASASFADFWLNSILT